MDEIDVKETVIEACKLLDKISDYDNNVNEVISESDLAICDIYHYIESNNISTKGCYRVVKELKSNLLKRRKAKQDQELINTFNRNINKLVNTDNRKMLISEIERREKQLSL